jgi:glycosyltransferase involved in cell wall biosynthesis
MRIMHISTRLILGGSQENTVLSCEGQAALGHDVALVFGPIYGPEGSLLDRVRRFHTHDGRTIEAIETPNLTRELHPVKDLRCCRQLRQLVREWKPDIVHTHSSKAGILGRLAAWTERVPCVIHTIHGPPFHKYEKAWRNAIYALSERIAAKRCHAIAAVAEAMRDQFLAHRIGRPEQYAIVYSGMEVETFLDSPWSREHVRRELGLANADFVVGTVARLTEHKGHDDLLDVLGETMQHDPRLKLLWVGDGWWRERLLQRVSDLGLRDRVITTGLLPPEMIPKYLAAMDVLAHPSYREGLPRTVTQALLAALPVVAYDVDGTREVCIDGETGRLVPPGDRNALREAILWMRAHSARRRTMGETGREMCRTRFAAGTMVDHLLAIYQACLRGDRDFRHILSSDAARRAAIVSTA